MKKFKNRRKEKVNKSVELLILLILLVSFLIIYFLQVDIFSVFTIAGIQPNLFVIFILFIGLFGNNFLVMFIGIFAGLFIDSIYSEVLGITSAMLCLIGFIATWFDSLWSKDEKISIVIMVFISTFIFEYGSYFIRSIIFEFDMEILPFIKILLVEELYNVLLTIIFFKLLKKLGYTMERKLKKSNMYTVKL